MPVVPGSPDTSPVGNLGELQRQFVREILYRDSTGLISQVVVNGRDAERRLAIYRTNARENFAQALEAAYPLLLSCMGSEEFRQLAWAYQRACPSTAGNLFHLGERLPGFLGEHLRGTEDEYLIDIARLEWAVQQSLVATNGPATLDTAALAEVPADRREDLRFFLHPSVGLLRTQYGVFGAWEARQSGQPVASVAPEPECLLVQRLAAGVQLQRLTGSDFEALLSLQRDGTLALPADAQVDAGSLLVRWVLAGVITHFTLCDPSPGISAGAHSG